MTQLELNTVYPMGELGEIYNCIEDFSGIKFLTRKVILTGERIKHMNEDKRHPHSYDRYGHHIPESLHQPDCILQGKQGCYHILKKIGDNRFNLILWIKILEEPKSYCNSLHTFYPIGQDKWLKNKKVLYNRK